MLAALDDHGEVPIGLRSALAIEAFAHTAAYDARIAAELPCRMFDAGVPLPAEPGLPGSEDPYPPVLTISMAKVETLRYGENPHQPAARYRRIDREPRAAEGPFASGEPPLQGKALSYNNVLDASAAAALARLLRGHAVVIVKHTNPCGAAERDSLLEAWDAALAGDPVSAFGGVVALTGPVDRALAERLTSLFLEVVVAPAFDAAALEVLATKPNLRLVVDPSIDARADRTGLTGRGLLDIDYLGSVRTAGGAVLVTAPDRQPDEPAAWACVSSRRPTDAELRDLDLAWRLARGVVSNAIVLVRDGMLVGPRLGAGEPGRRVPGRHRQGAPVPGRGWGGGRGGRLGRVLPVRRRAAAPARCRRAGDRPARRLDARRRGPRGGGRGRRGDARDRDAPLPPLIAGATALDRQRRAVTIRPTGSMEGGLGRRQMTR